jgi:ADP-heptose:LPS heptosyltransferase
MAALIAHCRLLIGNDSGPMHVAAALGVPVVAIFGPGDPDRSAPYAAPGSSVKIVAITRRYPCAPCRQAFFQECYPSPAGKPMCLESVGVEEVVRAAREVLDAPTQAAASPAG